jgi:hypothetical protein
MDLFFLLILFFIPAKAHASIQGKENRVIVSSPPNISMTNTKQFDNQGQFFKFYQIFFFLNTWENLKVA